MNTDQAAQILRDMYATARYETKSPKSIFLASNMIANWTV